jgi:3'(2'), 5'-bisphosphate nucleotidase
VVDHVSEVEGRSYTEDQVLAAIDRGMAQAPTSGKGRFWTLDPIDGTKGFLRKEQYAVALALIEDGQPVLGVLGCPNLPVDGKIGVMMVARQGKGASQMPLDIEELTEAHPISVSNVLRSEDARICESVESGHSDQGASRQIADSLGITSESLRMDSQCKYAAVARGDASIYLRLPTRSDYREKIWDHAAGMICVQAAGGTVTDAFGVPLDFRQGRKLEANRGIIASNGRFHAAIVQAVQAQLG